MADLFPTFAMPELHEQRRAREVMPRYGRSWAFDFAAGDFVAGGAGRTQPADGHTAWAHWCIKAVQTERHAYLVYGPGFGCDSGGVRQQASRPAAEAHLERAITEALLADPRTERVHGFTFAWEGDQLTVSFIAEPVIGTAERLEVRLSG